MSMNKYRCPSMLSVGATLCLAASATEKVSMVSLEILSIRNRCLPRSISAACRRELWDPRGNRKVPSCRVQQDVFSQWSMERVVSTWFSDNGEHPTNQSGISATCATRGIASGVGLCVFTGACSGPYPA